MKKLQYLPIGKSSFEVIRGNDDLYVDKTRQIYRMVTEGAYYFLSRPRRFGKSLTISTLRCLFEGKKELFSGLWIAENTDWEWKAHPVVLLDFNEISHDTPENLSQGLESSLRNTGQTYDLLLQESLVKELFKKLVLSLNQKTGMPVVILIDEYDKPIIDHLGKGKDALEIAKANRDILKSFFGVIKGGDVAPVLRFVFLTGVSKFSRVSIFSELNNLEDISMVEDYADMLGYTHEETRSYFMPYIHEMSLKRGLSESELSSALAFYYNGYRFTKKDIRVYNPFSLMAALKQKDFRNYWFETGAPTFLVNLLAENGWYLPDIENMQATEALFSVYEIERLQLEALLFQTGYVTIKEIEENLYTFDYPNQEVKTAFLELLFYTHAGRSGDTPRFSLLSKYLRTEDLEAFIRTMTSVYASIPYQLESNRDEAYFHTIFYLMLSASAVDARSEVLTCKGRIDLAIHYSDKIYIIEFKCDQSAQTGIDQIRKNRYADPYLDGGKKILLMGVNFDTKERNVAEWKLEEMT